MLADDKNGDLYVSSALFDEQEKSYPALTKDIPAFHVFEREFYEEFNIEPKQHPWLKPLRSEQATYPFFEMEGEELLKYLEEHDGKITFTVPEGYQNNVQIICTDCAMNSEGMTNAFDETFEKVTVSASQIVIFYANKPLFYGTVAALLAVIGGTAWFVVYKKKKNEEDK